MCPGKLNTSAIGSCKCGKVKIELSEEPVVTFKCHCTNCYKFRSKGVANGKLEELDTHHPVVAFFRPASVKVVQGQDMIEYMKTRGSFPFFSGLARGYCKECKTVGVVEYFTDLAWFLLLGLTVVYVGNLANPEDLPGQQFEGHICYNTATPKAKTLNASDGKKKMGFWSGMFAVIAAIYFRSGPLRRKLKST